MEATKVAAGGIDSSKLRIKDTGCIESTIMGAAPLQDIASILHVKCWHLEASVSKIDVNKRIFYHRRRDEIPEDKKENIIYNIAAGVMLTSINIT